MTEFNDIGYNIEDERGIITKATKSKLKAWMNIAGLFINKKLTIYRTADVYEPTANQIRQLTSEYEIVRKENKQLYDIIKVDGNITRRYFLKIGEPNIESLLIAMIAYSQILLRRIQEEKTGYAEFEKKLISQKTRISGRIQRRRVVSSLQDYILLINDKMNRDKKGPTYSKEHFEGQINIWKDVLKQLEKQSRNENSKKNTNKNLLKAIKELYLMLEYLLGTKKATKIFFSSNDSSNKFFDEILGKNEEKNGYFEVGEQKGINLSLEKEKRRIVTLEDLWLSLYYICKSIEKKAEDLFKNLGTELLEKEIKSEIKELKESDFKSFDEGLGIKIKTYTDVKKDVEEFLDFLQKTIVL